MTLWLLLCISIWGLSCLATSMNKHQRDIFVAPISDKKSKLLKSAGWGILTLSACIAIFAAGISVGLSEWVGIITFAAFIVAFIVTYQPRRIIQFNFAILVLFLFLILIWIL